MKFTTNVPLTTSKKIPSTSEPQKWETLDKALEYFWALVSFVK